MKTPSNFLGDLLKGALQSRATSSLAQSPVAAAWLLFPLGDLQLFMLGMGITSYQDGFLHEILLVGVLTLGTALLVVRKHPLTRNIMLALMAVALAVGMITGYFANADLYDFAMARLQGGEYERAKDCFETLDGFRDSEDRIAECDARLAERKLHEDYGYAMSHLADSPDIAYSAMHSLAKDGYQPAIEALATPEFQTAREAYYSVGNTIYFGTYLQPIESAHSGILDWYIVARDGDRALLVSCYVVDDHPYHDTAEAVTWADSSIRHWLNSEFIAAAFTPEEQAFIQLTTVENGSGEGVPSQDRIFLLSYDEACRYITKPVEMRGRVSRYMDELATSSFIPWLLRPIEADNVNAPVIGPEGELTTLNPGLYPSGVRPAMWVTLDPAFF